MEVSNFARLGRAVCLKAVGLQENYKKVYYTTKCELDPEKSGCSSCPNYNLIKANDTFSTKKMPPKLAELARRTCENCPHRVMKETKKAHVTYVNEKNMFGYQPRLKTIPLKLLIAYHYLFPDNQGIVKNAPVRELAEMLQCDPKSIHNANKKLEKYGYITLAQGSDPAHFHVLLTDYKNYGKKADEGGRGYLYAEKAFLDELIQIKDINQLRILVRAAFEMNLEQKTCDTVSMSHLRNFLPRYCKPNVIQKALLNTCAIFDVDQKRSGFQFSLNDNFLGRNVFERAVTAAKKQLNEAFSKLDEKMLAFNERIIKHNVDPSTTDNELYGAGIRSRIGRHSLYVAFSLSDLELHDLAIIATSYGIKKVTECIPYIYEAYHTNFKVKSIGALTRSILKNITNNALLTA